MNEERKAKIKALRRSKNVENSFWIIAEQVFQMLVWLVVGVLSARYLGPQNYGTLNYTASFVTFFNSIATLGMEGVVIKKMIDAPDREGAYLGGCIVLRLGASLLSIISIEIIIWQLNPEDPLKLWLGLIQGIQLFWRSFLILDSWFQRYLKSKYVSIGKMAACLTVAAYRIFLLATGKSIIWFAFVASISEMVVALTGNVFYRKESTQKLRTDIRSGMEVLKESYHFILSGLMVAIYSQMDKIMIGSMLGDMEVGLYTTANTISSMWVFIPTAVINSFRPMILELKSEKYDDLYFRRLKQLYSVLIWMCIAFSLFITLFGRLLIWLLYGKAYLGATNTLRICAWYELFAVIGTARGIWVLAEEKNKYVKYYLAVGAVVNLILNSWWIPVFGINGAAFATLITQITTSLLAPLLFKETKAHTIIVLEAFVFKWRSRKEKK